MGKDIYFKQGLPEFEPESVIVVHVTQHCSCG